MLARTHRHARTLTLLALWLTGATAAAASLPDSVLEQGYALRKVGAGELRWLGFPIYEASLWSSSGRYTGLGTRDTVALSLWYQRSFTRDGLVRVTEIAWRKLGEPGAAQRERWLADIRRAWTDVTPDSNVTTVVIPGGPTRFYDHRGRFAQVDDPAFGPAFLAIWLDPRSLVGELRRQLLGGSESSAATASN